MVTDMAIPSVFLIIYTFGFVSGSVATLRTCQPCVCTVLENGTTANCVNKGLSKIPSSIPADITELYFAHNYLTHIYNHMLRKFIMLQILDLSDNQIISIQEEAFSSQGNLRELNLRGNSLLLRSTTYPKGLFKHLSNLTDIDLSKNDNTRSQAATYPDDTLSELTSLETLKIDGLENATFGKGFVKLINLTTLSLSGVRGYCSMQRLFNTSFIHTPSLKKLDISSCKITYIEMLTFWPLRKIDVLDISYNQYLKLENFQRAIFGLRQSDLRILRANEINLLYDIGVRVGMSHVQHLAETSLEELYFDSNNVELIDDMVPTVFPKLKVLSLQDNRLRFGMYLLATDPLTELEHLHLSRQNYKHRIPIQKRYTSNLRKNAASGRLSSSSLSNINTIFQNMKIVYPVPSNLRTIDMSKSELYGRVRTNITMSRNKFQHANFSHNQIEEIDGFIKPGQTLELLDVSHNNLRLISPLFTESVVNIKVLNLSNNALSHCFSQDVAGNFLKHQDKLETLGIANNAITRIPSAFFKGLRNLKEIDLSSNYLSSWDWDFSHLLNLTEINLSKNKFEELPKELRNQIERIYQANQGHRITMSLNGNSLKCDCGHLDYLVWLQKGFVFVEDMVQTVCMLANGTRISMKNLNDITLSLQQKCQTVFPIIIGGIVGVLLFCTIAVIGMVYRYRWKLRYLMEIAKQRVRGYQRLENIDDFTYDAFVSYADEDREFVTRDMREILEESFGMRLCIHHRDFLVGEAITTNIINAIQSSRKTIVVLSPNFLKSDWCNYEIQMAMMESVYSGRSILCVIWYKDVPDRKAFSVELLQEMAKNSYITYPEEEENVIHFWEAVRTAISVV